MDVIAARRVMEHGSISAAYGAKLARGLGRLRALVSSSAFDGLRALPRVSLVGAPTLVSRIERFETAIGSPHPIFLKRDDAIPFGFGGNKLRKLELVLAKALADGATSVITCGGLQSNHCRATAAAATSLGLGCDLVLSGARPDNPVANTRLDEIFGARLHFVPNRADRVPAMEALAERLKGQGGRPHVIPLGASTALGAAGFALGFAEMIEQGHRPSVIVHASSSGGTQAGLVAGAALQDDPVRIMGISADEPRDSLASLVGDLAAGVLRLAGSSTAARGAEVLDDFVGGGYGIPTDASREALVLLARSEGVVVDHTYTAKALAGLIALVRGNSLPTGSSVLFWHTGGQAGL
jgi:L-cysteate sulfo-lyase